MQKTWTFWSSTRFAASVILLTLAAMLLMDAWQAWHAPGLFPFGIEGPAAIRWTYQTKQHYLISAGLQAAACWLAMIGLWLRKAPSIARWLCFAPLAAWVTLMLYEWAFFFE